MKLIPYDKFQFIVNAPISEVRERLADHVEPRSFWNIFAGGGNSDFIGKIENDSFKIHRNISYRNSFLPNICGSLEPHPLGTKVSIRMRLHLLVIAFLIFWIFQAVKFTLPFSGIIWADIGQLVFLVGAPLLMTYLAFWFEAKKAKIILEELYKDTANTPLELSR